MSKSIIKNIIITNNIINMMVYSSKKFLLMVFINLNYTLLNELLY